MSEDEFWFLKNLGKENISEKEYIPFVTTEIGGLIHKELSAENYKVAQRGDDEIKIKTVIYQHKDESHMFELNRIEYNKTTQILLRMDLFEENLELRNPKSKFRIKLEKLGYNQITKEQGRELLKLGNKGNVIH